MVLFSIEFQSADPMFDRKGLNDDEDCMDYASDFAV